MRPHAQLLDFHDFDDQLKDIIAETVLYTAVPKPKVHFVRETLL